jgi:flagellar protein FliS
MFSSLPTRPGSAAYQDVNATTAIDGASPHKLVSLLYATLASEIARARGALARRDVPEKCRAIGKAVRIVDEGLKAPLDMQRGGAIAENLCDLYDYLIQRLTLANLHNDDAMLAECGRLTQTLREGWDGIADKVPAALAVAA